ncbi:MAG: hypothetical protein JO362_22540 [Streptomycetaceae bacterium]|nr:hypothetical protein [Streptomycetaceae bacterium]
MGKPGTHRLLARGPIGGSPFRHGREVESGTPARIDPAADHSPLPWCHGGLVRLCHPPQQCPGLRWAQPQRPRNLLGATTAGPQCPYLLQQFFVLVHRAIVPARRGPHRGTKAGQLATGRLLIYNEQHARRVLAEHAAQRPCRAFGTQHAAAQPLIMPR